jgi:gluconokinase
LKAFWGEQKPVVAFAATGFNFCGVSHFLILGTSDLELSCCPNMKYPRSPKDQVGGLFYFARMMDKIRLMASADLHPDLHANLGQGFDERVTTFLAVNYSDLKNRVLAGGSDEEILEWCFQNGTRPTEEQIEIWNSFMFKRGWNDELSERLVGRKKESGFDHRDDIQTMFQYIDADEGRI